MTLNESGLRIAERALAEAASLGIRVVTAGGTRVVDCGVETVGSDAAGIVLAEVALAGRGRVWIEPVGGHDAAFAAAWPGCPWPVVAVQSDAPVAACLAAQYAGWKVKSAGYFAMASGPMRAAIGREPLFDTIGLRERAAVAVGVLEAAQLPPPEVCRELAAAAGVTPDALLLLVARTASRAGTLQVIARSLETALHKLHEAGFDLGRIERGVGRAPLAPVAATDLAAIGCTNDAILYGGSVTLEVRGDDASLREIGPRAVSGSSPAYGAPFATLLTASGVDFYAIDPDLFAPALVEFANIDTGRRHRFGGLAPKIVEKSFATAHGAAAPAAG
ncbi:methenyltetrahydromethanopterin cyclohydrolase [bacterium]|nr:methenyltetrahydromethanopterin cyclohydrolase [bacterium]